MEDNQESGIWQRVTAPAQSCPGPEGLLRESAALTAVYRRLAGNQTGRVKHLARQLLEEELSVSACLRGIGNLRGSTREAVNLWEPGSRDLRTLLEGCYHRARHCQREYAARSLDGTFGEVYRDLAEREGRQCARIAELLGWIG